MAAEVVYLKLKSQRPDMTPGKCTREQFDLVWGPRGWIECNEDGTPKTSAVFTAPEPQADPPADPPGRPGKTGA